MKDYEYYKAIAFGDDLNHPESSYAKELVSFAYGEGFAYNGNFYHGNSAIDKLNKLLKEAEQTNKKIVSLIGDVFDGSPEIELS